MNCDLCPFGGYDVVQCHACPSRPRVSLKLSGDFMNCDLCLHKIDELHLIKERWNGFLYRIWCCKRCWKEGSASEKSGHEIS
jgi:hypothetical protein